MKVFLFTAWCSVSFGLVISGCNNLILGITRWGWSPKEKEAWEELYQKANKEISKPLLAGAIILLAILFVGFLVFVRYEP